MKRRNSAVHAHLASFSFVDGDNYEQVGGKSEKNEHRKSMAALDDSMASADTSAFDVSAERRATLGKELGGNVNSMLQDPEVRKILLAAERRGSVATMMADGERKQGKVGRRGSVDGRPKKVMLAGAVDAEDDGPPVPVRGRRGSVTTSLEGEEIIPAALRQRRTSIAPPPDPDAVLFSDEPPPGLRQRRSSIAPPPMPPPNPEDIPPPPPGAVRGRRGSVLAAPPPVPV